MQEKTFGWGTRGEDCRGRKGRDSRAFLNPTVCELRLPLKMEAVTIGTQGGGGGGGDVLFKTHFTTHFLPTPGAWGSELRRKVKEKDLPACRGVGAAPHPVSALSPPPDPWVWGFFPTSSSPLGRFQRWSEGDRTSERKGENEIRQNKKNPRPVQKYPTAPTGPAAVRRLTIWL